MRWWWLSLFLLVSLGSAEDDSWFDEVLDAPDAEALQAAVARHEGRYNYGTVKGFARAAEGLDDRARARRVLAAAAAMASRLDDDQARFQASVYQGHVLLADGELALAAVAYQAALRAAEAADWPVARDTARAWLAVVRDRQGDSAVAHELIREAAADWSELGATIATAEPSPGLHEGWAAWLRAQLDENVQRWPAAEEWYLRAVDRWSAAGVELALAAALDRAGLVSYYQSKLDQAQALYERSLAAAEAAGSAYRIGRARLGFAEIAMDRADYPGVEAALEAAQAALADADATIDLARVHLLRASVRQVQGRHDEVEAALAPAEALYRQADSRGGLADCDLTRGTNWLLLGDRARAIAAFDRAGAIYAETHNYLGEANIKLRESHAYRFIGQLDQARSRAEEALELYRLVHDRLGQANSLRALGRLAQHGGDPAAAEALLRQALELYLAIADPLGESATRTQLGIVMVAQNAELAATIEMLLGAMETYERIGDRHSAALPALELGRILARQGEGELAYGAFSKALADGEASGSRAVMASALYSLGQMAEQVEPPLLAQAEELYRLAIEQAEGMRSRAGGQEAQQAMQESHLVYYDALIRVLLKQGKAPAAFAASEAAHARTLLDLVADAGVDPNAGMSVAQRAREEALSWRLAAGNVALGRLLADEAAGAEAVAAARRQVLAAREELAEFRSRLFVTHPELSRHRAAAPITAEQLGGTLPPNVALLEYHLGDPTSYVFLVHGDPAQVLALELPLTATELNEAAAGFRAVCANPRRRYLERGRTLAEQILTPALERLPATVDHLVIVPDQGLHEVPFQALPLTDGEHLWDRFTLSYAISASLLHELRGRGPGDAPKQLLAFADPTYGELVRSPDLERGSALAALPGTALEAANLVQAFGPAEADVFAGAAAQEAVAKAKLPDYRLVHFATHGLLDSASPLYSSVVLAEPPAGGAEDGQLEAREIMGLKLRAELVTLSACETGRGRVRPGEGLVGLSWALTAAGARAVMVSHWKVSDDATQKLMSSFYRRLAAGEGKAAALRAAALALREDDPHPYYWAPFVLIGSW